MAVNHSSFRRACTLTFIALGIASFSLAEAYPVPLMAESPLTISPTRTVKVIFPGSSDPAASSQTKTTLAYFTEYLQAIANYANWNVEFVDTDFANGFTALQNGDADLMVDITRTTEREAYLDFSSEPMGTEMCYLYAPETTDIHYDEFSRYDGLKIGYLTGSTILNSFQTYATLHGFSFQAQGYSSIEASYVGFKNHEVDALIQTNFFQVPDDSLILSRIDPKPVYFATRKSDSTLKESLDNAMAELLSYNPSFSTNLYQYYFESINAQRVAYSVDEESYLASKPTVHFLYETNWAPFEYDEKGTAKGISPDVTRALAKASSSRLQFSYLLTSSTEEVYKLLNTTNTDCVMGVSYSPSWTKNHDLSPTQPFVTGSVLRAQKSSETPQSVAVVEKGYLQNEISKQYPSLIQVPYQTFNECMAAVDEGAADCTFLNYYQVAYFRSMDSYSDFHYQPSSLSQSIAFGVSASSHAILLPVLCKLLQRISASEIQGILSDNSLYVEPLTFTSLVRHHPLAMTLGIIGTTFLLLIILFLLVYIQRRKKQNEMLAAANKKAEEASKAKSEFLSRMSHDIRTPLNGIIGMTYLAQEKNNSVQVKNYLSKIDTSSKFLLGLVNDILDMSKAESGKIVLHPEPYPIQDCVDYLNAVIAPQAQGKGQTLTKQVNVPSNRIPLLDKLRTNQILFNLLSNAVKFTPAGGHILCQIDEVLLPDEKLTITILVQDDGIGMSESFQKVLYDPFTQEDRSDPTIRHKGTGLGMAITKSLVEAMGGTISLVSAPNEGSAFTIVLTSESISLEEYEARASGVKAPELSGFDALKGKRVLLCEDNPINLEIARSLLLEKGMNVDIASDGEKGVSLFRASALHYYDVILMDIRMPNKDGYEATVDIRSLPREDAKSVPIIAMTADAFADDVERCKAMGMDAHIAKPVNPALLYETLARFLSEKAH